MKKKTISDSKIVTPLVGDVEDVKRQIAKAETKAHYFEARFDLLTEEAKAFLKAVTKPLIITLKPSDKKTLHKEYEKALLFNPAFIDIDYQMIDHVPAIKAPLILSSHEGLNIKDQLKQVTEKAKTIKAPVICKVALTSWSPLELFDVLAYLQKANREELRVLVLFCGALGRFMRLITPLYTPQFSFVAADEMSKTDAGQITIDELETLYKPFKALKPQPIYALLGNPTSQSRGPIFHNNRFIEKKMKGLYVTIDLEEEEALPFLEKATYSKLFKGFSITMPYKTAFASITNTHEPINTLVEKEGEWEAINTDGRAAINLISEHILVEGSHMVILGTGGTARAIGRAGVDAGMRVTLISRSKKQIEGFTVTTYQALSELTYDVLVQATPAGFKRQKGSVELEDHLFLEGRCFLECVQNEETEFLAKARRKKGKLIEGHHLFEGQAILQSKLWQNAQTSPALSAY